MKKLSFLFAFCFFITLGAVHAQQCVSAFQFSTNGLTANFVDSAWSSTGVGSWTWDFGDSTTSTLQNPSHTYSQSGTYYVCLTISNIARTCTDTWCDSVTVTGTAPLCNSRITFADSIIDANCGSANGFLQVYNLSGGVAPYSYSWSNGSTSSFISNLNAGTYSLTITDANACDTVVSFTVNSIVSSNFTYVDSSGTVTFTSTSGGPGSTYSWSFGDSTFSTLADPTHTYAQAGSYIVCLTVSDSNRVNCTFCDTVIVSSPTIPCKAGFTVSVDTNKTATFTNTSSPISGSTFVWEFGDGDSTTGTNPVHTYSDTGVYVVTLTMTDSNLTTCTYTDTIIISSNMTPIVRCHANYIISLDTSQAFSVFLYNASSHLPSHTYFWDFGDSSTSTLRNPTHQFQSFGSYLVCLTITDTVFNCSSTFCDTVGMDSLGNLKTGGFGIIVQEQVIVGIEDPVVSQLEALNVYPNPASSAISVDMSEVDQPLNISILDITGKVVLERTQTAPGQVNVFDLSGLNNGFYFMLLDDGVSRRIQKIIKSE